MVPNIAQLKAISKASKFPPTTVANMTSVIVSLERFGNKPGIELNMPHRLNHYIAQLAHESGAFKYDKEIWGNTPAQQRYDVGKKAKDLGNTPEADGDGKLYMGRTGIQLTGKANYTAFRDWVWKNIDKNAPDFVKEPNRVNEDPWEGLVPIWFWTIGNRTGKSLNRYADLNDIEVITKIINGGLNGFADRLDYYARVGLVFLGHNIGKTAANFIAAVEKFQKENNLTVDGDAGPRTRAKIHEVLAMQSKTAIRKDPDIQIKSSPITQKVEVPVAPKEAAKPAKDVTGMIVAGAGAVVASPVAEPVLNTFGGLSEIVQLVIIGLVVALIGYLIYTRVILANRTKENAVSVQERNEDGIPSQPDQ